MLGLIAGPSVNLSVWVSATTLTCTIPRWVWENFCVLFCIQLWVKWLRGPPFSVSTHFTPISSMLDLGSGWGTHVHSGTPAPAVEVSEDAFGSISKGCTFCFYPLERHRPGVSHRLWVSLLWVFCVPLLLHIAQFCRLYNRVGLWRPPLRLIPCPQIPLTSHRASIILEMCLSALRNHQWKCHLLMPDLVTGFPLFKIFRIWLLKWTGKV